MGKKFLCTMGLFFCLSEAAQAGKLFDYNETEESVFFRKSGKPYNRALLCLKVFEKNKDLRTITYHEHLNPKRIEELKAAFPHIPTSLNERFKRETKIVSMNPVPQKEVNSDFPETPFPLTIETSPSIILTPTDTNQEKENLESTEAETSNTRVSFSLCK